MNARHKPIPLPGVLGEIADVAGEDAAIAIAKMVGGTRVYFPPEPDAGHWLSKLIGHDCALRVCDRLTCGVGGVRLDLPLGPRGHGAQAMVKMDALIRLDRSERDIALATGYSTRMVRYRRAKLRAENDDRQLPLL